MSAAAPAAGPAAAKPNVSKMLYMLPLMFLANKITYSDDLIFLLRIIYYTVQLGTLYLAYVIIRQKVEAKADRRKIFLPPVVTPFAPPDAERDAPKETTYHDHEIEQVNMLVKSTCIGLATVSFIHWKMGVKPVLLLQSIMGPMNLTENGLIKKYLMGSTARVWNETLEGETDAVAVTGGQSTAEAVTQEDKEERLEKMLDKVFNKEAEPKALLKLLTKDNINYQTKSEQYTPLMVLSSRPDVCIEHIKRTLELGADTFLKDEDGCTALHWAAMKGVIAAATVLTDGEEAVKLLEVKDGDKKTALELAIESVEPDHDEVEEILTKASKKTESVADLD